MVVRPPLVRKAFAMSSDSLGTLPVGTRLHVIESRRTTDGAQRVCVALVGEESTLGWLTARRPDKLCNGACIRTVGASSRGPLGPRSLALQVLQTPQHCAWHMGVYESLRISSWCHRRKLTGCAVE